MRPGCVQGQRLGVYRGEGRAGGFVLKNAIPPLAHTPANHFDSSFTVLLQLVKGTATERQRLRTEGKERRVLFDGLIVGRALRACPGRKRTIPRLGAGHKVLDARLDISFHPRITHENGIVPGEGEGQAPAFACEVESILIWKAGALFWTVELLPSLKANLFPAFGADAEHPAVEVLQRLAGIEAQ